MMLKLGGLSHIRMVAPSVDRQQLLEEAAYLA